MLLEKHSDIRRNLIAIVVSLFLACILTWPVVISPFSQLVGHPGNDTWNHVWGYWWVSEALEQGVWPEHAKESRLD